MAERVVRMGVVGIGGYAQAAIQSVRRVEEEADGNVKLGAIYPFDPQNHPEMVEKVKSWNVPLLDSFDALMASDVDGVWLPVPIHLHRSYTEKALAAGKAVLCEKPAAGCIDDVDAMIAARDRAKLPVVIGYQDMYHPVTWEVKSMLVDGRLGEIRSATLHVCWPRDSVYYGRNTWAGKFKAGDQWVMDSPVNNAMAHYLNLALFLLGREKTRSAQPQAVEAELYRANPIENFDTISMRIELPGGVPLLVMMTHACEIKTDPTITIHGEKGTLTHEVGQARFQGPDLDLTLPRIPDVRSILVRRVGQLFSGEDTSEVGIGTLETARCPLVAIGAASEAATIHDIPAAAVTVQQTERGTLRHVPGLSQTMARCAAEGKMLHESGLMDWTVPAGRKDGLAGYRHFAGPRG